MTRLAQIDQLIHQTDDRKRINLLNWRYWQIYFEEQNSARKGVRENRPESQLKNAAS